MIPDRSVKDLLRRRADALEDCDCSQNDLQYSRGRGGCTATAILTQLERRINEGIRKKENRGM